MINEVAINIKIESILEPDNRLFLAPNNLGLYNASEMVDRFAQARAALAMKQNDPLASTTYAAFSTAAELFVSSLDQSESLVTINGAYWCDLNYLSLILKFCSNIYADAVNALESRNAITLGEWADYTAKRYSVICFFGDSEVCYLSGAIWSASRILRDPKGLHEHVLCTEIKVNTLAKEHNLSDEDKSMLYNTTWRLLAHGMNRYMQLYAEKGEHDYPEFIHILKECFHAVDETAIQLASAAPTVAPKKKGFLSRFF